METINGSETKNKSWYDKSYRILLLIPILVVIISLIYLGYFYYKNDDIMLRDSSLAGGTTVTLIGNFDQELLESSLKKEYSDISIRKLTDIRTGKTISFIIESSARPEELKESVEKIIGYELTDKDSSTEFTGPSLSKSFYKQLIITLFISFILMSFVVFVLFRTFIPSIAVIFAAFSDIVLSLALINYLGIKISAAGIAAFLMLIGYSVDTDILLTSRALRKGVGTLNKRIYGAFKTGFFMTAVTLTAILPAFLIVSGLPDSFRQIFFILSVGLVTDIFNTWLTNTGIIKWYCEKKRIE